MHTGGQQFNWKYVLGLKHAAKKVYFTCCEVYFIGCLLYEWFCCPVRPVEAIVYYFWWINLPMDDELTKFLANVWRSSGLADKLWRQRLFKWIDWSSSTDRLVQCRQVQLVNTWSIIGQNRWLKMLCSYYSSIIPMVLSIDSDASKHTAKQTKWLDSWWIFRNVFSSIEFIGLLFRVYFIPNQQ